jgi:DNA gyrase subunit B
VGSSVVNALSTRLRCRGPPAGHVWRQSFATAAPQQPLEQGEATDETGTTITFWPDRRSSRPSSSTTTPCAPASSRPRSSTRACASRCATSARLGVRSTARTAPVEKQQRDDFHYERGLVDYVEYLNKIRKAEVVNDEIIEVESEDTERHISLELAMQWTTSYTENVFTFANTINTHEGGTHEEGFRAALTTSSTSTRARTTCSRRRTTTSRARTSARASPPSSR